MQLEAPDVGACRRNRGCEIGVKSAPIGSLERQTYHEFLAFELLPVDLEPAFGLLHQHQQVRTVRAMNANPSPSCYIPHNRVSGYRLTTLSVADHHAVDALNTDALGRSTNLVDQPVERALLWRLGGAVGLRIQLLQHLGDVDVALPDRGDEMIEILEVEGFRHFHEVGIFGLREPTALDFPIEDLAA